MLTPGNIVGGRYEIVRALGGGGMKLVYLVEDSRLKRKCALAEMIDSFTKPEEQQSAVLAFEREAQMLAALEHPSVPKVYDFFSEDSLHYLVMEYVEGKTLEQILAERKRLPWREAARIGVQVLHALTFLHERNPPVLYRDLKPSNLIVAPNARVRIVDFGIARHFNPALTATVVGTQGYAPPEQYKGKNEPRSDLYSFGALMHHAVTGRDPALEPPFSFPSVRDLANDCDPDFAELIDRCLAYQLDARPASGGEARMRLQALLSATGASPNFDVQGPNAKTIVLPQDGYRNDIKRPSPCHRCTKCAYENPADVNFCASCAAPLREPLNDVAGAVQLPSAGASSTRTMLPKPNSASIWSNYQSSPDVPSTPTMPQQRRHDPVARAQPVAGLSPATSIALKHVRPNDAVPSVRGREVVKVTRVAEFYRLRDYESWLRHAGDVEIINMSTTQRWGFWLGPFGKKKQYTVTYKEDSVVPISKSSQTTSAIVAFFIIVAAVIGILIATHP